MVVACALLFSVTAEMEEDSQELSQETENLDQPELVNTREAANYKRIWCTFSHFIHLEVSAKCIWGMCLIL